MKKLALSLSALLCATAIHAAPPAGVATEATKEVNAAVANRLPIADQTDFENARKGFLAKIDKPILNEDGSVAWDPGEFEFIKGAAPDTVNPSLWRQGQLTHDLAQDRCDPQATLRIVPRGG